MAKLIKCVECGRMFETLGSRYCVDCMKVLDEQFGRVYQYIREHPKEAHLDRVSEETGVPRKTIWYFVRQGKIELASFTDGAELAQQITSLGDADAARRKQAADRAAAAKRAREQDDTQLKSTFFTHKSKKKT